MKQTNFKSIVHRVLSIVHSFKSLTLLLVLMVAMMTMVVGSAWGATAAVNSATPTDGKSYIIAIYYNSEYYALPNLTSTTGVTPTGKKCTLTNGKVTAIADCSTPDACLWTLAAVSGKSNEYKIYCTSGGTSYYLYKNGTTGDNYKISGSSTQNGWAFKAGTANNVTAYGVKTTKSGATKHTALVNANTTFKVNTTNDTYAITLLEIGSSKTTVTAEVADGQSSMGSVILYDSKWVEQTDGKGEFDKDAIAILYASNETDYRFTNWTLTAETDATWDDGYSATDDQAQLKIGTKDVTATAHFAQEYTISVTQNDENMGEGAFNTSPTTSSKKMIAGEQAEIVATVVDDDAYEFVSWTVEPANAVTFANANAATTTLTATAQAATVTANFQAKTTKYAINLTQPTGAIIAATPLSAAAGNEVTLSYNNVAEHYHFVSWTVVDGSSNPVFVSNNKFTMPESAVTVSASFEEDTKYTVEWYVAGAKLTEGSQSTSVYENEKVTTIPTAPADNAAGNCATKFMGWSTSNLGSAKGQSAPTDLFTTQAGSPTVTSSMVQDKKIKFYAVFASEME